jgi:serine protease inhibitor
MQRVLKTDGLPTEKLNAAYKELNESLKSQTNVILDLADSIWYRKDIQLRPDFIADNANFFQAELAPVDFTDPKSADIINNWAERETRGKIKNVVTFPFPLSTAVVLANTIYFNGKWLYRFEKSEIESREFYLADGKVKQVPMLSQRRRFSYQEGDDFQAVQLPYAGDRLQMCLFLPTTNSSPQKLLAEFSGENWLDQILLRFPSRYGFLAFPKFKINYGILLNDSLESLGMKRAFVFHMADFQQMAMNDDQLFITEVKQKCFVDVNEEGTEAGAATVVNISDGAILLNPPGSFEMIVNRPFLFLIADKETLRILFMGIVDNPSE